MLLLNAERLLFTINEILKLTRMLHSVPEKKVEDVLVLLDHVLILFYRAGVPVHQELNLNHDSIHS